MEETILQLLDRCEITKEELISAIKLIKSLNSIPMVTVFSADDIPLLLSLGDLY